MRFKFINYVGITLFAMGLSIFITKLPAKAEEVCQVTDPTDTPLNVRDQPNGRIINTLRNGRKVRILAISYDSNGRIWTEVSGYYKGEYRLWGWVFREFISCYKR